MTWVRIVFDLAAVAAWLRTVLLVVSRPAGRWRTRRLGKALSLLASLVLVSVWFGWFIPWGAAVVWWRVLVRGRDPFELPMADGRPMP